MKKLILETKRPWNWKEFLALIGLVIPAVISARNATRNIQNGQMVTVHGKVGTVILE